MTTSPRLVLKTTHKKLGLWLAFIAGSINAGGFMLLGTYTSHMTGIGSSIGDFLAFTDYESALWACAFLISFVLGAMSTALIVNRLRDRKSGYEYSGVLLYEALLLVALVALAGQWLDGKAHLMGLVIALMCYLMGLQNALITKISGALIRTTHITGLLTDAGIELGRILYRALTKRSEMTTYPDKLVLFTTLALAFIAGGIGGAFAFQAYGFLCMLPIAAMLALLSITLARP